MCEGDYVIVAADEGNVQAIEAFATSCNETAYPPSALHFAQATTSAAATTINILNKVKGGNLTINAGPHRLLYSLLAAAFFLEENPDSRCHIFFDAHGNDFIRRVAYVVVRRDEAARFEFSLAPSSTSVAERSRRADQDSTWSDDVRFLIEACGLPPGATASHRTEDQRTVSTLSFTLRPAMEAE
jgi:hypothetical protein